MANPINWVELPATDMNRAVKFYNTVMGWDIKTQTIGQEVMAWFPFDKEDERGASGSLVKHSSYVPSKTDGAVVYFSVKDVQEPLDKVEAAGGTIVQSKKQISPEHGFMALIIDTEGNRIAFHSQV